MQNRLTKNVSNLNEMLRPKVTVRFFASTRELVGINFLEVDLDHADPTVADLLLSLRNSFPGINDQLKEASIAVNRRYILSTSEKLRNGDVIAILPPISGG